jgi:hypothetical protein
MTAYQVNVCRHCLKTFRTDVLRRRPLQRLQRPLCPFPARSISGMPVQRLQIPPPDPAAPKVEIVSPPPRHDLGLTLGEQGIPVPPSPHKHRYPEDKAWAETVSRTLSGGTKSEYLKCISVLKAFLTIGTELDEHGNVRVGMQAFKKMELCTMVCTPFSRSNM